MKVSAALAFIGHASLSEVWKIPFFWVGGDTFHPPIFHSVCPPLPDLRVVPFCAVRRYTARKLLFCVVVPVE